MSKRIKTNYPGVYYRMANRIGGRGTERVYYAVYKKNGKTYEEKVGRQHKDAMTPARAARIRGELVEGKRPTRKEGKAQELAQQEAEKDRYTVNRLWNEYRGTRNQGRSLEIDAGRYGKYLRQPFGTKEPRNIIKLDIDRLGRQLERTKSLQTVKHVLSLLSWIINFGANNGLCEGLSFKIKMPKVDNTKTEDLNDRQIRSLLRAADKDTNPDARGMMKLALCTGLRRGEMFKLKWQHIDFDREFIWIVDPKGGPSQFVPLNTVAREILEAHEKTGSEYVFPGRGGRQRVTISKAVNRIKKQAGLPKDFRPLHGLRHVYASGVASSGEVNLHILQRLLTHKDPRMTQRYAHFRDDALKKAAHVAGSIIEQAAKEPGEKVINTEDHEK